jgi:cellobiose phosphorylase
LESEYLQEHGIFLAKRRSKKGEQPYMIHMVRTGAKTPVRVEYENDRKKFIGRNHTLTNPEAVMKSITFSNQSGFCNDPIMSLRIKLSVDPGESVCVSFVTGVCESREEAIKLSEELNVCYRIDDIMEKFRLQKDIELKYLEITRSQMNAFQDLISPIFYPSPSYRGPEERIRRNFKNQSFLWRFGVSGDNPILLLRVKSMEEEGIIKDVLKAYEYLRLNRVMVDLVILIEAKHGYLQEVADLINDMTSSMRIHEYENSKPSFFVIYTYQMIPAEIDLLYTVARVVFSDKTGVYFRTVRENIEELTEE